MIPINFLHLKLVIINIQLFKIIILLQNHCGCDCSLEIKIYLLLGGKIMTNPGSVLKSRDITWLKKFI